MTIYRNQNDTAANIKDTLVDDDGAAVPITGFTDVTFELEAYDGSTVLTDTTSGNVSVPDAGAGEVEYDIQSGDLADAGTYYYTFEVEYGNGEIETFPNRDRGAELVVSPE
jgi:hypothetical protein